MTTVFSGYNFGSSLQALAGKIVLQSLGYKCQIVALRSLIKGRDIRLRKLFTILYRSFAVNGMRGTNSLITYKSNYEKEMVCDSASRFVKFTDEYICPQYHS